MIDSHCHLEQKDYDSDRNEVIEKCKKELKAVVTCCARPEDFDLTMQMAEHHKNFVFASVGIHPEYVKEISEKEIENFIEKIKTNKEKIFGLGENGLDFWWIKEAEWQQKQKELFIRMINFAKEITKPLVVHCRNAYSDCIKILEQEDAKEVHLHMWGDKTYIKNIVENGWMISLNTMILKSKKYQKVARDIPLENLMTETDSPWLGLDGKRNEPLSVKSVIKKLSEIKKIDSKVISNVTTSNAIRFFHLPI